MEKVIYVNPDKEKRAKEIIALFTKLRLSDDEEDLKRKVENLLADAKLTFTDETALTFIYQKVLGGLVRTPAEQKAADKNKEEIRRKRKVDLDSK